MSLLVTAGSRFGPYEVLGLVGTGGMSEVYRARDPRIGRDVALKLLKAAVVASPDGQRRFEQEVRATGQLNHPNIVTVFDVGTEAGMPFLVCEVLEGTSLRERLAVGTLPPARVADIGLQVARGLAAAHEKGVVHRDLKPENLFITRDGRVKILDFGIAKLTQIDDALPDAAPTAQHTVPGLIVGTHGYMSPEQVKGELIDGRSDLFSWGVVLYEALTGRRPFTGSTAVETMTAILHEEPGPPSAVTPAVSAGFDRIVLHCLEKDPRARFQSARDLAFALESVASGAEGREHRGRRVGAIPRRWYGVPAWSLGLVVAAGAAVGFLATRSQPQIDAPSFSRVTRLPADRASATQPVLSADQKWVAYLASTEDRTDVCVKYLNGGQTVNLTANEHEVAVAFLPDIGTLDISPDGTLIAFGGGAKGTATNQLSTYVLPAPLGGTPRKLVEHGLAVRWSPDGQRIAYIKPGWGAGDSLWVADANGEHPREVMRPSGGIHAHWPAWSADSRFVYFNYSVSTGNLEPVEVFRVPVDGGEPERVIATSRRAMYAFPSLDGRGLLYSSNPVGIEMGVWWKPVSGPPIRVTTGVGEYGEPRLSRDGRAMVATVFQVRQWLAALSISSGQAITSIGSGATRDIDATVSPAGDRMAFSSMRNGERNIWTSDLSGANARLVTAGPAIDERPAWSPDGRRIAFVSDRGGQRGIWITDIDGGAPRHVVDAQVLDTIAWSPDGTQLVYAESVNFKAGLFLVPADGGSPPRRLQTPAGATAPTWSVATNVIAYIGIHEATQSQPLRTEVGFLTPSGQIPRPPLSAGIDLAYGTIAWSPDEKAIAGVGNVGGVAPAVWLLPLEGPGKRLRELPKRPRGITWTRDGSQLIVGFEERTGELVLFDQGR